MKNKKKSGGNAVFVVIISILSIVTLINISIASNSFMKGIGGDYKPSDNEMYSLTRNRYEDVANTYQRIRTDNMKLSKDMTALMAVGSYYYDKIIYEAYKESQDAERMAFYQEKLDEARSKMNDFTVYAGKIDKLIEASVCRR